MFTTGFWFTLGVMAAITIVYLAAWMANFAWIEAKRLIDALRDRRARLWTGFEKNLGAPNRYDPMAQAWQEVLHQGVGPQSIGRILWRPWIALPCNENGDMRRFALGDRLRLNWMDNPRLGRWVVWFSKERDDDGLRSSADRAQGRM